MIRSMDPSPTPTSLPAVDEARRLERLHALGILDTDAEPMFDTMANLAASLLGTPIALISFVDAERQWFKAELGLGGVRQTSRDVAFCSHAIEQGDVFEVHDASQDARFRANPLVTGAPGIRFYAAAPIEMPDGGERLGTLCVIDRHPRTLTPSQREQLQMLARLVAQALQLREQARRRVEVELAGHIASLNSVLDDLPVSVTVWDANFCNVYANATHGRWSGTPPHEILGRRLDSLLRPDRFNALKPYVDVAKAGRASTFEGDFTVLGQERRMQIQLIPHAQEGGRVQGFAALTIDVTAERHAQALRGRLAALVEHTDDAILGLALDGTITDWNEGATRLFGHTEAEARGRPCAILLGDPDDAALRQRIARLVGGDPVAPFETELADRGGRTVPVSVVMSPIRDSERRVIGVAKTLRDISRLREIEKALRDSRAFLDRTGRIAGVGGWEIDLRSEQVTWSAEVCRIHERPLGYRLDVSEGLGYFNRDARRRLREALAAALAGAGPFDLEAQMTTANGRSLWVRMAGTLEYENGLPVRCVGAMQDITEQLARRTELRREHQLRVQLQRHAEHLDELLNERNDMLRVLAHEVRQPLNNASAALQSAAAALAGSGKSAVADRLQRARDVMGHVLAGVDNTLAAASLLVGSGQAMGDDTDIDTLVAVALADLPANDRARVQVLRETSTRTATMDMGLMRLALRNLMSNALKYAPPDSPVTVRLTDSDDPLALIIDVTDRGTGFEAELLPRMFQRGERGRLGRHAAGHGLGLYIVHRVMERHGGQVLVASNVPGEVTMRLVITQSSQEP